jgi:hypothetical protein
MHSRSYKQIFYSLLPIPLIGSAHAAYLSGDLVSNSYGVWPFLVILLTIILSTINKHIPQIPLKYPVIVFSCCLSIFTFRLLQSNFLQSYIPQPGKIEFATLPALRGMGTRGPWIPNMEEMFRYVERTIPQSSVVAFLPGEDPFYAVTGRKNPLPFVQFNYVTYTPWSYDIIYTLVNLNVEWIVAKTDWQIQGSCCDLLDITQPNSPIKSYYSIYATIPGYSIYKRNQRM